MAAKKRKAARRTLPHAPPHDLESLGRCEDCRCTVYENDGHRYDTEDGVYLCANCFAKMRKRGTKVTVEASASPQAGEQAIAAILELRKLSGALPYESAIDAVKRMIAKTCAAYTEQLNAVRAELCEEQAKTRRVRESGALVSTDRMLQRLRDAIDPSIEATTEPELLAKLVDVMEARKRERPLVQPIGFDEYQRLTRRTVDYSSSTRDRMAQFAMGAAGEAGELSEVVKKHLFHDRRNVREKVREEAGDCAWYLAQVLDQFGISMQSCIEFNLEKTKTHHAKG